METHFPISLVKFFLKSRKSFLFLQQGKKQLDEEEKEGSVCVRYEQSCCSSQKKITRV